MLGPCSLPHRWRNRNPDGEIRQTRYPAPRINALALPAVGFAR